MSKEITITIIKEDLQALYSAYLIQYYGGLQVQCVEMQKDLAEQKKRIATVVNEALGQTEIDKSNPLTNN
jgi:hypothetical protein